MGWSFSNEQASRDLMAGLPDSEPGLLAAARECVDSFGDAVLSERIDDARKANLTYEAVVLKLNGGTFFGCMADSNSAANIIGRHCAAPDGVVPAWGQAGTFLLDGERMRAIVRIKADATLTDLWLELWAIDVDSAFISPTGYRSFGMLGVWPGMSVADSVHHYFEAVLNERGAVMIESEHKDIARARIAECPWASSLPPREIRAFVDNGQVDFGF